MGISGISGVSAYGGIRDFYPIYSATPVDRVGSSGRVTEGSEECQTCENRKYVDGSNESDVSFKTPTHISPENASAAVLSHEKMHLSNAVAEGSKENKELVSASISLKTSICPECGKTYVAGGETRTTIRTTSGEENANPYAKKQAQLDYLMSAGKNFDISA